MKVYYSLLVFEDEILIINLSSSSSSWRDNVYELEFPKKTFDILKGLRSYVQNPLTEKTVEEKISIFKLKEVIKLIESYNSELISLRPKY